MKMLDNKLLLFASFRNLKQKKISLLTLEIDKHTLKVKKEINSILDLPYEDYQSKSMYNKKINEKFFKLYYSDDLSKIGIIENYDKLHVYDKTMKKI